MIPNLVSLSLVFQYSASSVPLHYVLYVIKCQLNATMAKNCFVCHLMGSARNHLFHPDEHTQPLPLAWPTLPCASKFTSPVCF